jgi:hypothetical protein
MKLWNNDTEIQFFQSALNGFAAPEKLFYKLSNGYFAYISNESEADGKALQSRNSLIGNFTEKWARDFFAPIARQHNLFAVNGVECAEIGLVKKSEADLAFCTTNDKLQKPNQIKLIFEVKMSIVSNYQFVSEKKINLVGDHTKHKGIPSLLRSDSMLKAIGKAINIRVSGIESASIPIVVLGNSPISKTYGHKVDSLKQAGVVQSFFSLSPSQPLGDNHIAQSTHKGFQTIQNVSVIEAQVNTLLQSEESYFSAMMSKPKLGEIIRLANEEKTDESKAEKFLSMIRTVQ